MRKLLASLASAGLLVVPAASLAQDGDNDQDLGDSTVAGVPLGKTEPLDVARIRVDAAAERVDQKHDRIRERGLVGGAGDAAPSPQLQAIAQCESGGDYTANTGNGFYGAYQFTEETWASVGGSGLPSEAPPTEQDMRAQTLLEQSGTSPWPVCGS